MHTVNFNDVTVDISVISTLEGWFLKSDVQGAAQKRAIVRTCFSGTAGVG
jgi:hypothetical protein